MKRVSLYLLVLALIVLPASTHAAQPVRHEMKILLRPEAHELRVEDKITLPEAASSAPGRKIHFLLHDGLAPTSATPGVQIIRETEKPRSEHFGMADASFPHDRGVPLAHYTFTLPAGMRTVTLKYRGTIHHPIEQKGEEYARGFAETPGTISDEGIYLAGTTYWYPWFNEELITFHGICPCPVNMRGVSPSVLQKRISGTLMEIPISY